MRSRICLALAVAFFAGAEPSSLPPPEALREALGVLRSGSLSREDKEKTVKRAQALVARLDHPRDVWQALVSMAGERSLEDLSTVRQSLKERLAEVLRQKLADKDRAGRLAALTFIADQAERDAERRGPEAEEENLFQPLAGRIAELARGADNPAERARALRALSRTGPPDDVLLPALRDVWTSDIPVKRGAAEALAYLFKSKLEVSRLPALVALCGTGAADKDAATRRECLTALRQPALVLADQARLALTLLDNPSEPVARKADARKVSQGLRSLVAALDRATPAATSACKDEDIGVSLAAHDALEALARARGWVHQLDERTAPAGKGPEARALPQVVLAVPALVGSLKRDNADVRLAAIYVLERLGPDAAEASGELVRGLSDGDRFVRWGSARALRNMAPQGAAKAVPALAKLLDDKSRDVRVTSAQALLRAGSQAREAVGALAEVAKGRDPEMAGLALRALAAVGSEAAPAEPAILAALSSEDERVRAEAARTLGKVGLAGKKPVREALTAALEDAKPRVRQAAAEVLLEGTGH